MIVRASCVVNDTKLSVNMWQWGMRIAALAATASFVAASRETVEEAGQPDSQDQWKNASLMSSIRSCARSRSGSPPI